MSQKRKKKHEKNLLHLHFPTFLRRKRLKFRDLITSVSNTQLFIDSLLAGSICCDLDVTVVVDSYWYWLSVVRSTVNMRFPLRLIEIIVNRWQFYLQNHLVSCPIYHLKRLKLLVYESSLNRRVVRSSIYSSSV